MGFVVAIDGPAGTGKSTATRRLANALGFTYIDTGALYRALAHLLLQKYPSLEGREREAAELARSVRLEFKRMPELNPSNRIFADGVDVTASIRSPEVSMAASRVSAIPEVRAALLGLQRQMGIAGNSILEGRDIGTVVFPRADVKFFLTASLEERAKRRVTELEASGKDAPSFEEVKAQIEQRDHGDSTRSVAPLKKAEDAIEIDTSDLTLDQVVALMESRIRERLKRA